MAILADPLFSPSQRVIKSGLVRDSCDISDCEPSFAGQRKLGRDVTNRNGTTSAHAARVSCCVLLLTELEFRSESVGSSYVEVVGRAGCVVLASLGVVCVDGLLERRDVAEGEQEQHHQLALVADGRHLHQQPQRRACTHTHALAA